MHMGGAAHFASQRFGAQMGVGVGPTGQCYAIPTMQGETNTIQPYVNDFVKYAQSHPELRFYVTEIGCGIAGFTPPQIAPLFASCVDLPNIFLPLRFWHVLNL